MRFAAVFVLTGFFFTFGIFASQAAVGRVATVAAGLEVTGAAPAGQPVVVALVPAGGPYDQASVDLVPTSPGRQSRIQVPGEGTYAVDEKGQLTFRPVPDFRGRVTVPYLVLTTDHGAQLAFATLAVGVGR